MVKYYTFFYKAASEMDFNVNHTILFVVVGSLSYESIAANSALEALGLNTATQITDASAFVTVLSVMTIGIAIGLILVPFCTKKIQCGIKISRRETKMGRDILKRHVSRNDIRLSRLCFL